MPQQDTEAWQKLLAQYQDPYAAAEEFSNEMPPVGTYTAKLTSLRRGVTKKDAAPYWSLNGELLDGVDNGKPLKGMRFQVGFYSFKVPGLMKGAVRVLNGAPTDDLGVADQVFEQSVGKFVRVEIVLSRDGAYKNCFIREVLQAVEQPAEAPTT